MLYKYDRVKDNHDERDHIFEGELPRHQLPASVDLRGPYMPQIYQQGSIGSCTGNAVAAMLEYQDRRPDNEGVSRSRLWIYYQARVLIGLVNEDSGCQIRDAIKVCAKLGAPPESVWPYHVESFKLTPTEEVYQAAALAKLQDYKRLYNSEGKLMTCLAQGNPVVLGIQVYDSLESSEVAASGKGKLPSPGEAHLGGHAVLLVGYDVTKREWLIRNSWGMRWGQGGYFTLPWEYLLNPSLTDDLWTATSYDYT